MTPASSTIPPQTGRWFFGYPPERLDPTSPFVISRLLEEGDGADLRWLITQLDEATLRENLESPKSDLSRRSRTFWRLVLGMESEVSRSEVWPLDR